MAVVLTASGVVIERTLAAGELFDRWFSKDERGVDAVPAPLIEHFRVSVAAIGAGRSLPLRWNRLGQVAKLCVSAVPLRDGPRTFWALVLQEVPLNPAAPPSWSKLLTPQEHKVAERVLPGWSNALVADDLGCSVATIKKHL